MESAASLQHGYIDTHTHFVDGGDDEADLVVARALDAGVVRLLAAGTNLGNSRTVLCTASRHPAVYAAVGIHPNDAEPDDDFDALDRLAAHEKVRAVGETGLDYYRTHTSPDLQRSHIERHMQIAARRGLPIILHNREADDDLYVVARAHSPEVRGVLHCFSGTLELAVRFMELGYFVSFAGNVTYSSATALRQVATQIPSGRLLVETDSPYLAPVPFRGQRNEPARVVQTYAALALCRSETVETLRATVANNARRLFGW